MTDQIKISESDFSDEFEFQTSRSSGAGGQNVNKVETKVALRFSINDSKILDENQKTILKEKLANQLIDQNILQVISQESRSQLKNKENCIKKFKKILKDAFFVPKKRKPLPIPVSIIEKRLSTKKHNSEIKANRNKIVW